MNIYHEGVISCDSSENVDLILTYYAFSEASKNAKITNLWKSFEKNCKKTKKNFIFHPKIDFDR